MSRFSLPKFQSYENDTTLTLLSDRPSFCLNPSLKAHLNTMKGCIDKFPDAWDSVKRLTNPYEYIHTHPPQTRQSVSKKNPCSRAYFKMIELIKYTSLNPKEGVVSFHLAEGPGGFIEALIDSRPGMPDKHYGMTLLSNDSNVPGWSKGHYFLSENPERVEIVTGVDGTGNIFSCSNLIGLLGDLSASCDLITADGGIDFSANYADQELTAFPLILAEICYALCLQREGGTFVIKMFDTVLSQTADIINILCTHYTDVTVHKPCTSRAGNSERYLVCRGYRCASRSATVDGSIAILKQLCDGTEITSLGNPMPCMLEACIREINCTIGQRQLENMAETFDFIHTHKKSSQDKLVDTHISICVQWCKDHKIQHTIRERSNVFLGRGT